MASASAGGGEREKRLGVPREGSCTHKPQDSNSYDIVERILSRNDDDYLKPTKNCLCLESIIINSTLQIETLSSVVALLFLLLMVIIPSYLTFAAHSHRL